MARRIGADTPENCFCDVLIQLQYQPHPPDALNHEQS
jgi:hypothetical protein